MARITVSSPSGQVVSILWTDGYDLSKPLAQQELLDEITDAVDRADQIDDRSE